MNSLQTILRQLPKMDVLLASATELLKRWSHKRIHEALKSVLKNLRERIRNGETPDISPKAILSEAESLLKKKTSVFVVPAINATGTVLHTGLGRSVLPRVVLDDIYRLLRGYSVLEIDRETGRRCSRIERLSEMLCEAFGVESALAVNNDASAVMLTLNTHAKGNEVIVSRGELVEIGGSFRLPEIIAASGVKLVEVGTTNRTRLEDYENAISDATKILLKVHPSNYRIVGYTEDVPSDALAQLGKRFGLLFIYDLGSGAVIELGEPTIKHAASSGADIITFSGDKLFGGCQAGIILGKESAVAPLRKNPLYRALRLDKIKIGILERVVSLYLNNAIDEFPMLNLIKEPPKRARLRAMRILRNLPRNLSASFAVVKSEAEVGGGSMAAVKIPSYALAIKPHNINEEELAKRLRLYEPPIFVRTTNGQVLVDTKTVFDDEVKTIAGAITSVLSEG